MANAFKCDICGKLWEGKPIRHPKGNSNDFFLHKVHHEGGLDVCLVCHESLQSWARHRITEDEDYDAIRDLRIRNRDLEKDIRRYTSTIEERDEQIEKLEQQLREAEATMRMLPIDEPCEASGADPQETIDCIKMGR